MAEDMKPGEIARLFAALTTQIGQVAEDVRGHRADNQRQFEALEAKYATRDAVEAEMRLVNVRQDSYERQTDVKLVAYDAELQTVRNQLRDDELERRSTRRVAWGAVLGIVTTVISAVVITLLNVHS